MNKEQLQGNWQQLKGKFREKWGELTEDNLEKTGGQFDKIVGEIINCYGITKDQAAEKVNQFLAELNNADDQQGGSIMGSVNNAMHSISEQSGKAVAATQQFIQENPMTTLSIALLAGLFVGALVGRSR